MINYLSKKERKGYEEVEIIEQFAKRVKNTDKFHSDLKNATEKNKTKIGMIV